MRLDDARLLETVVTEIDLPPGLSLDRVVGLRITARSARGRDVSISDHPLGASSADVDKSPISYRLLEPGPISLSVSSCPQWRTFKGNTLYVRHDPDVKVESVDFLTAAAP